MKSLVALLLLGSASAFAEVPAERFPIAPPSFELAAGTRIPPSATESEDGFLAAWIDSRLGTGCVWATRFSADGRILTPAGFPIAFAIADSAFVASDGRNYLVGWSGDTGVGMAFVRPDGSVERVEPAISGRLASLKWTGSDYAAIHVDSGAILVTSIDRDGRSTAEGIELVSRGVRGDVAVSISDHTTMVIMRATDGGLRALSVPNFDTHIPIDLGTYASQSANVLTPAIATDGRNHLVVWREADGLRARLLDPSGNPLGERIGIDLPGSGVPTVVWNGSEYVVATYSDTLFVALRLDAEGVVLDSEPHTLAVTTDAIQNATLVSGQRGVLALSTRKVPMNTEGYVARYDHIYSNFLSSWLTAGRWSEELVSSGPRRRLDLAGMWLNGAYTVAWIEGGWLKLGAVPYGGGVPQAEPLAVGPVIAAQFDAAIASGDANGLVTWIEKLGKLHVLYGALVTPDGVRMRAGEPFVIDQIEDYGNRPVVVWDGRAFVVFWTRERNVVAIRVRSDGTVLDTVPRMVLDDFECQHGCDQTSVARSGDEYFLTAKVGYATTCGFSGACTGYYMRGTRVTADLRRVGPMINLSPETTLFMEAGPDGWIVGSGRGGSNGELRRLRTVFVNRDGTTKNLDSIDGLSSENDNILGDIYWNGQTFVLTATFLSPSSIRRITRQLTPEGTWTSLPTIADFRPSTGIQVLTGGPQPLVVYEAYPVPGERNAGVLVGHYLGTPPPPPPPPPIPRRRVSGK